MDNTKEKLIELQKLSGLGEKFERQLAIQKQFAEKMKLIDLLTDRIPGIDNELRYVDDERVERLADHLIANGVTIQKWIPVTERLPDKDGEYLVRWANKSVGDAEYECKYGSFGHWIDIMWDEDADWFPYVDITHWMPLPEAPKGD